ncbi:MAG: FG-GAP-like repeat-containing protein [Lysobacter sp.]|nr:FG-GAP-like repeat-containing protein [Lysobacter sp.]
MHTAYAAVGPTGEFVDRYPIEVPEYHGLQPDLAFVYGSSAGTTFLGNGWMLSGIPEIRKFAPGRGLPDPAAGDQFEWNGNELLRCDADPARAASPSCRYPAPAPLIAYTSRIETHHRIAFDPATPGGAWTIWDKSGRKSYYVSSATGTGWRMEWTENTLGQRAVYRYRKYSLSPKDMEYPDTIEYNRSVIRFVWQSRPDVATRAQGTQLTTIAHRLAAVEIRTEDAIARVYALRYKSHPDTERSTLIAIQEYGIDATIATDGSVSGSALPVVAFDYEANPGAGEWKAQKRTLGPHDWQTPVTLNQYGYEAANLSRADLVYAAFHSADVDADGRSDGVLLGVKDRSGVNPQLEITTRLASQVWTTSVLTFAQHGTWLFDEPPLDNRQELVRSWVADVNGDERDDLVVLSWRDAAVGNRNGDLVLLINAAVSMGDGTFAWSSPTFQDTGWRTPAAWGPRSPFHNLSANCSTADVNGDGRSDLACMVHSGISVQSLGVAYARASGGFQIAGLQQVADDPGVITTATGATAAVPFETRPMSAADVNRDGLADIIYLEPRSEDLVACADSGDPVDVRAGCDIRFDLVTGLSTGDRFVFSKEQAPWSREDQRTVAPGSIGVGDFNGDGRADILYLPGQILAPGQQKLRSINAAIRSESGTSLFTTQVLPTTLSNVDLRYSFGDFDGDMRTDLIAAVQLDPSQGTNCAVSQYKHALVFRIRSAGDGNFALPTDWRDCAQGREVVPQWSRWTEFSVEGLLQTGDTNGDGLTDAMMPTIWGTGNQNTLVAVSDQVSEASATARARWSATDVDGDRRSDLVRISGQTGSNWIYARRVQNGGGYSIDKTSIRRFEHNGDRSWRWLDLNGDGRMDVVHLQCEIRNPGAPCELRLEALIADGNGRFSAKPTVVFPGRGRLDSALTWQAADIDGDGRSDLIALEPQSLSGGSSLLDVVVLRSVGDGTFVRRVDAVDVSATSRPASVFSNLAGWRIADINADRRADLVYLNPQTSGVLVTTLISTLAGSWQLVHVNINHPSTLPTTTLRARNSTVRWYATDANGDGATDFVRQLTTDTGAVHFHTLFGNGGGTWTAYAAEATIAGAMLQGTDFGGMGWLPSDVDGDDDIDLVHMDVFSNSVRMTAARSDGRGGWRIAQTPVTASAAIVDQAESIGWVLADNDADGQDELLRAQGEADGSLWLASVSTRALDDRLARVRIADSETRIEYGTITDWILLDRSPECGLPMGAMPRVVRGVKLRASQHGQFERIDYGFTCPRWSQPTRSFLGWREVIAERAQVANRPAYTAIERYDLSDACGARIADLARRNTNGTFVGSRSIIAYLPTTANAPFVCLPQQVRRLRYATDTNSGLASNVVQEFVYDEFGNVTIDREVGSSQAGDERVTTHNYRPATGLYIVGLPAGEQLHNGVDSSAPILYTKLYCYDGDATIACSQVPARGQLTSTVDLYEQGSRVTRFGYDTWGNLASVIGADQNGMSIVYDPVQHLFPISMSTPIGGPISQTEWDRVRGLKTKQIDENGNATLLRYDPLGRIREIVGPTGVTVTRAYANWDGAASPRAITDTVRDGSPDGLWTRQVFDGLGRTLRVEKKGAKAGEILVKRIEYADTSDHPHRMSNWFRRGATNSRYQTLRYDADGFLREILHPDGTRQSWRYDVDQDWGRVVATDAEGRTRETWADGLDRIVRTRDYVGGQASTVSFVYDGRNQLGRITDPNGNVTTYAYNRLGQNTKVNDPNLGLQTLVYDKVGNLVSATDAQNRTTTYTYDARSRLRTRTMPGSGTATWNYDEPTPGASRGGFTSLVDPSATGCAGSVAERRIYDQFGRLATIEQCIRGQSYRIGMTYDALNRTKTLTYPDGEIIDYGYDPAGRLYSVSGWIDAYGYDTEGRVSGIRNANGTRAVFRYDREREQIANEQIRHGAATLYDASYVYKVNGSLDHSTSRTNAMNLSYVHDELGRVTLVGGDQSQTWSYDVAGNLKHNSRLGYYTYPAQGPTGCGAAPCLAPHGVRSAGTYSLNYNANGLVSSVVDNAAGKTRSIDWTVDRRPQTILDYDGTLTLYTYDGWGRRVQDERVGETIRHIGSLVDVSSVSGTTKYYFAGNRMIGASRGGARSWLHGDRAGTIRLVTNDRGAVAGRFDYSVYGRELSAQAAAPTGAFGGQRIGGTLLAGARVYDPEIERFLGPDTIVPNMLNSQAFNRYLFNYGAPTEWVDPSGHQPLGVGTSYSPGGVGAFDMGSGWMHQPWAAAAGTPPGFAGTTPTSLNFTPLSNWQNPMPWLGSDGDDEDDAGPDLAETLFENAPEIAFGGVTGGLQGLLPAGWLLPLEKITDELNFNQEQKAWFEVGRGSALTAIGIMETIEGVTLMVAGAPPTIVGGATVATGVGGLVLAGGATLEVAGAVTAVEGVADVLAGLYVLNKSGLYVLLDKRGKIRYVGIAKDFRDRGSKHGKTKPPHKLKEAMEIDDPDVRRGLEQWAMEHCKSCDWNKYASMSPDNKKFVMRMFKTFEWLEQKGIKLPSTLEELLINQGILK